MFSIVFSCLLVLHGVRGIYLFPVSWRYSNPENGTIDATSLVVNKTNNHTSPEAKMYFENFNFKKLNPVNWFYDHSEDDKMEELYNLVKCLIEDDHSTCQKKLQTTRKLFENKKSGDKGHKENSIPPKEESTFHHKGDITPHKDNFINQDENYPNHKPETTRNRKPNWKSSTTDKPFEFANRFQTETSSSQVKPAEEKFKTSTTADVKSPIPPENDDNLFTTVKYYMK